MVSRFLTRQFRSAAQAIALALLTCVLVTACASHSNAPWSDLGQSSAPTSAPYRLTGGDKLKIVVFGENALSGTYEIGPDGNVSMPLVGNVPASGATVEQFRRRLNRKLSRGYLRSPKTTVSIAEFQPVFVHGEVKQPGKFAFQAGMTFSNAIALAGGYTYRAEESYILLTRRNAQKQVKVAMPSSHQLQPGDNIRIPERFF